MTRKKPPRRKPLPRLKSAAQERRAMEERAANEAAAARGEPLPFPNPWDVLDPTKVGPNATPEEMERSHAECQKRCHLPTRLAFEL